MTERRTSPDERKRPRRRGRLRGLRLLVALAVPPAVLLAGAAVYFYVEVARRFESGLWTLPSRIYSDELVLVSGMPLEPERMLRLFDRLGYARTDAAPLRPGQVRRRGRAVEAHLRSFEAPWRSFSSRLVRFRFQGGELAGIEDEKGRELERIEIEPERLALVFGPQHEERQVVRLADVPRHVVQAVLAAEDSRFYSHRGVDLVAVGRAAIANLRSGRIVQGGSTITQQAVKNLYLGQGRTWGRKLREVPLAVLLELRYTKTKILEVYLNHVYLGQSGSVAICGIESAAYHYLGRGVADLSVADAALLAGLIRNPGGYNPFVHADRALARRDLVLQGMVDQGWLSKETADKARREPLRLARGGGGFLHAPWAVDFVRAQLAELDPDRTLAAEGLRIFTTVDPLLQDAAEASLERGLERLERERRDLRRRARGQRLEGALVALDPQTGAVRAMVGGRDWASSQFNRAILARRQPGSCFKPFVYLAGFEAARASRESGLTPATLLEDEPVEIESGGRAWRPENYDGLFRGVVTAREALEQSLNVPTVRAALHVGLDQVVETAELCGFREGLKPLPSLALGAQEATPLELALAFATLAGGGRRVEPWVVRDVVDRQGSRIERPPSPPQRAVSPEAAYIVTDLLRGVLTRGTAASASALGFWGDAAGKTGTTDDTRDSWFVGYNPRLLALVWVGFDDNARTGLTGASGALPIWTDFMTAGEMRWWGGAFEEPDGIVRVPICPESGQLAADGCLDVVEEVFIAGTEPEETCSLHRPGFLRWWRKLLRGFKGSEYPRPREDFPPR